MPDRRHRRGALALVVAWLTRILLTTGADGESRRPDLNPARMRAHCPADGAGSARHWARMDPGQAGSAR